jgi:DNA topoisomerase-2
MLINTHYKMNADNISLKYQHKTDRQHILDNPDTYIGSVDQVDSLVWTCSETPGKMEHRQVVYIPGLYKLFDECVVNTRDHMVRMEQCNSDYQCSHITIHVDETGRITLTNDGEGIDVVMHPETNLWVPEMIFGHLRTSTNYNKEDEKIVGGKNGFGVKLVYVWSVHGTLETVDHKTHQKYEQCFSNNLEVIHPPTITKVRVGTKPYTKISFLPDYARLGVTGLSSDMIQLFRKRAIDLAAVTSRRVKVRWNGEVIKTNTFPEYAAMYLPTCDHTKLLHEASPDGHWEYVVAMSPSSEFLHVSFVNGIYTQKGGKHVDYILNQIVRKMATFIETKKKVVVSCSTVREQLALFIRCNIVNPSFDSQTKDFMNTPPQKFGSTFTVSDKVVEKLAKLGVMETACGISNVKEQIALKKHDGSKVRTIRDLPKLLDAGFAGTAKSPECMLIICEGDSAKAGITSGLSTTDRKYIGVYPLKGKILNVRGELPKRISENKEIHEIKRVLGLEIGRVYANIEDVNKNLRYSKVVFMTDQDLDGSHIKGLCLNLFHSEWNSLLLIPGFIGFLNTPILKASKGSDHIQFYNRGEYDTWKDANTKTAHLWKIKYYKGLGTSTDVEFREYLKTRKIVHFAHEGPSSDNIMDMVFNKKRADDRKAWLENYDRNSYLNTSTDCVGYEEFVHKELIHFSKYDCDRSIPNIMDGLKRSLRKILFSAFKKRLTTDIKVSQFSGYVSEHSGYHHGEASLNAAIVGMAQDFVGSNNVNLLVPNGQFGSRLLGGKDSASERYIYTKLHTITRCIFPEADDKVLTFLEDDGLTVEPLYYAPIIPMILVNGGKGIGTGFSTSIPCFNPLTIIRYLKERLTGTTVMTDADFIPYYEGFTGTIVRCSGSTDGKFIVSGKYEVVGEDRICITELPVGTWTEDYKEFLDGLAQPTVDKDGKRVPSVIKDYEDLYTKTSVNFPIVLHPGQLHTLTRDNIMSMFKLTNTISTSNMHLFDVDDKLKKYANVIEIIDEYFAKRLMVYTDRKRHIVQIYALQLMILSNRERYIQSIISGELDLRGKRNTEVIGILEGNGFDRVDDGYDYLTKMPMDSVTNENVAHIIRDRNEKAKQLEIIGNKPETSMWFDELVELETEYVKYTNIRTPTSGISVERPKKTLPIKQRTKRVVGGGGGEEISKGK